MCPFGHLQWYSLFNFITYYAVIKIISYRCRQEHRLLHSFEKNPHISSKADWERIAACVSEGVTSQQCRIMYYAIRKQHIVWNSGPWSQEEVKYNLHIVFNQLTKLNIIQLKIFKYHSATSCANLKPVTIIRT